MYDTLHNLKLSNENVITYFAIILCVSHQMVDHAQSPITMYLLDGCLFVFMFSHTISLSVDLFKTHVHNMLLSCFSL